MASPLVGAWERTGGPGIYVFNETHYAGIFEQRDRMRGFKGEKPTEAEEAEAYRTIGGGVEGLTRYRVIC